jgi:hypothetical protein
MISKLPAFCDSPRLKLDGATHSLGYDLFKFVYNVTNIISDKCRGIEQLKSKDVIKNLDSSYSASNNIEKNNLICRPFQVPILTTKGYIFAEKIEAGI